MVTRHIGLVATATTTYTSPTTSPAASCRSTTSAKAARAGTWSPRRSKTRRGTGFDDHLAHAERYERAAEFYEVVTGLQWDSWEEGGLLRNKASGTYMDRDKVHFLDPRRQVLQGEGAAQHHAFGRGWPVVAQAGSSEAGRDRGRTADVVFTAQTRIEDEGFLRRHQEAHRPPAAPDDIKIMPGLTPVLGRTMEEAQANYEYLQTLLPDDVALMSLSHISGGLDLSKYPLDGPLPDLPPSNAAKARQELIVRTAREGNMTLRQIARNTAAGTGHRVLVGTPQYMADWIEQWFREEAADGFNVVCNHYPKPFEDFCTLVVPELQRRGIFRTEYEGKTLRENLGLKVPDRYTRASHRRHHEEARGRCGLWLPRAATPGHERLEGAQDQLLHCRSRTCRRLIRPPADLPSSGASSAFYRREAGATPAQTQLIWYSRDKWDATMWRMVGRRTQRPDEFLYSLFPLELRRRATTYRSQSRTHSPRAAHSDRDKRRRRLRYRRSSTGISPCLPVASEIPLAFQQGGLKGRHRREPERHRHPQRI